MTTYDFASAGHRDREQHLGLLALACAVLLAAILRIATSNYALWFDEYASLFFSAQPLGRLWSTWMVRETNPPLFYTILHGWMLIPITMDRFWLRIPSIVASVLVIPIVYAEINRIYGTKSAVIASMILSISAQQIYYAQQVRCYSFLFLALAISFFAIMRMAASVERGDRVTTGHWIAYVGGAVTAIYLHTTAVFWPVIATVSIMLAVPQFRFVSGRLWLRLLLADVIIALGSSWWLYITFVQTLTPNANISWMQYLGTIDSLRLIRRSSLLLRDPSGWQYLSSFAIFALAAFGFVRTREMMATRLATTCWLVTVVAYIAISYKQPILSERSLLWIAIFPTTLIAAGLSTIRTPWRLLGTCAVLGALLAINFKLSKNFEQENWEDIVATIAHDPEGVAMVSGEGNGVVINEACRLTYHRHDCPFPVITLANLSTNAWAHGSAPQVPATLQHTLALPDQSHVYFIQRWLEKPLPPLHAVGVARSVPLSNALLVGPYSSIIPQLKAHSQVQDKVLVLTPRK